jgi:hypothetical protein
MDFTILKYKSLLKTLQDKGYRFITFYEYLKQDRSNTPNPQTRDSEPATNSSERLIILRHDVDRKPKNSLATAKIEEGLGIAGSYYFRMVPESFEEGIIREIAARGHEIGYHYETMDTVASRYRDADYSVSRSDLLDSSEKDYFVDSSKNNDTSRNDVLTDTAYQLFLHNLERFRQIADIRTICMHGSPRSKYDNREIWKKYSYRQLGIIGEPYFDVDFNRVLYLTDTGRRWDGWRVSVRDKVPQQEQWKREKLTFRITKEIIKAVKQNRLPAQIMITVHPQRWTNNPLTWTKELVWQNAKNMVKWMIVGIAMTRVR